MKKERTRTYIYESTVIDKNKFETQVEAHSHSVEDILDLQKKGLLKLNARIFLLEDIKEIAYNAFRAGWTMAQLQPNPKSHWSSDKGKAEADKIIANAFS